MKNKMKQKNTKKAILFLCALLLFLCPMVVKSEVSAAGKVALNYKNITIGNPGSFTIKLKNAKGGIQWKSTNKKVAVVNKKGVITAKKPGTTVIVARNKGKAYKCRVTVKNMVLENASISMGTSELVTLRLLYKNSNYKTTWSSSNKAVATVSSNGSVRGIAPGVCAIRVKCNKKTYTCWVSVKNPQLQYTSINMAVWRSVTNRLMNTAGTPKWTSSDPSIVAVDKNGKMTAKSSGSCVITASLSGVDYNCNVYVNLCFANGDSNLPGIVSALKNCYPVAQNQGKVLLAGSSSMNLWMNYGCESAFAGTEVINVGIHNTTVEQWVDTLAAQLILPYKPKVVVLYAGSNDIAGSKASGRGTTTYNEMKKLVSIITNKLPGTKVFVVSTCPCYARQSDWSEITTYNALTLKLCSQYTPLTYIDLIPSFTTNGKPREDLFGSDKLHPNAAGYAVWKSVIVPVVQSYLNK